MRIVMITGDNLATARTIAQRVGIGQRAATTAELEKLDGARGLILTFMRASSRNTKSSSFDACREPAILSA